MSTCRSLPKFDLPHFATPLLQRCNSPVLASLLATAWTVAPVTSKHRLLSRRVERKTSLLAARCSALSGSRCCRHRHEGEGARCRIGTVSTFALSATGCRWRRTSGTHDRGAWQICVFDEPDDIELEGLVAVQAALRWPRHPPWRVTRVASRHRQAANTLPMREASRKISGEPPRARSAGQWARCHCPFVHDNHMSQMQARHCGDGSGGQHE